MNRHLTVRGNLADVHSQTIYPAEITVTGERITDIRSLDTGEGLPYLIPGFVDAHIHIESSLLVPSEFARLAVVHGTVATVSDPHEIANVCGVKGVEYMIANGSKTPFKFNFGAPSCVPATAFETAGAAVSAQEVAELLQREDVRYLSEMMNFPGALGGAPEVMQKIAAAQQFGKPVDGHAPGLRGDAARQYIAAGISTDHECFTAEEALDKLRHGMKILIREGSAARNFDALIGLLHDHPDHIMFCSDDKHPDSLVAGHINELCARAAARGIDVFKILKAACVNPVTHYKLKVGLLRQNDFADFILVNNLKDFKVGQAYINGRLVADAGRTLLERPSVSPINHFDCSSKAPADFAVKADHPRADGTAAVPVIEALDGQLITLRATAQLKVQDGVVVQDVENDVLKIAVVNRYRDAPVATGFIKNFGLKQGAIASSVAHDSHNIVAVGADDASICRAVNLIIESKGGISCVGDEHRVLPLPVAGLMSTEDGYEIARQYAALDKAAKGLGATLAAPYMTLSFMALLVIPHLKLSDLGMFDGDAFGLVEKT